MGFSEDFFEDMLVCLECGKLYDFVRFVCVYICCVVFFFVDCDICIVMFDNMLIEFGL